MSIQKLNKNIHTIQNKASNHQQHVNEKTADVIKPDSIIKGNK